MDKYLKKKNISVVYIKQQNHMYVTVPIFVQYSL